MVGDDIRDDVIGAQEAGLVGALVKTGKYREGDEKKCDTKTSLLFLLGLENFLINGLWLEYVYGLEVLKFALNHLTHTHVIEYHCL